MAPSAKPVGASEVAASGDLGAGSGLPSVANREASHTENISGVLS